VGDQLQALYTPILAATADDTPLEKRILENALTFGPVKRLVAHETPSWLAVRDEGLAGFALDLVPEKEVQDFERRVDKFVAPMTEGYGYERRGAPEPWENAYRPLRNFLVGLQIGAKYQCTLAVDQARDLGNSREGAISNVDGLLRQEVLANDEEVADRLRSVKSLAESYAAHEVAGLRLDKGTSTTEALLKALENQDVLDASRAKWNLGVAKLPLPERVGKCLIASKKVLSTPKSVSILAASEVIQQVAGGAMFPPWIGLTYTTTQKKKWSATNAHGHPMMGAPIRCQRRNIPNAKAQTPASRKRQPRAKGVTRTSCHQGRP
jgi:hypothetical protein